MSDRGKFPGSARAKQPAVVAPSVEPAPVVAVVARTAAGLLVRSEGQRLLIALRESSAEIGRRVGLSKQIIAAYRAGDKMPSTDARRGIEAAFPSISAHAWGKRPIEAVSEPQGDRVRRVPGPNEEAISGTLAELQELLEDARKIRRDQDALAGDRLKAMQLSESLLARKAKLELAAVEADDWLEDRLGEMPRFQHYAQALVRALKDHPGALQAAGDLLMREGLASE